MTSKTKTIERNGATKTVSIKSVWNRAFTADSEWPDKVSKQLHLRDFLIVCFFFYRMNFSMLFTGQDKH